MLDQELRAPLEGHPATTGDLPVKQVLNVDLLDVEMAVSGMYICFVALAGVTGAKAQQRPRRSSGRDANTLGESNQGSATSRSSGRWRGAPQSRDPDPVRAPQ
jgi:hypothetical protein